MKKATMLSRFMVAALMLAALGYWSGKQFLYHAYAATDLDVRPFIAERVDYHLEDGKEVVASRVIENRRRDGARYKSTTLFSKDGTSYTVGRVDLPDGYLAMIADSIHAKATGRKPVRMVANEKAQLRPSVQCLDPGETTDGEDTLFNQRATKVIHEQPGGLERMIFWRLPDFACFNPQVLNQKRASASDQWQTIWGSRLIAFVAADPDPRLFSGWDNYTEMKPSEIKMQILAQLNVTPEKCPECFKPNPRDGDQTYIEWQDKK